MDLEKLGQKVVMDKIEDMVEDGVKKFIGGGAEGQKDDKGFNIDSVFGGGKSDDKGFNVGDVLSMVTPKDEGNGGGDLVEGMFKKALGVKETDEDKDKGFFGSFFGGDKKKDADDDKGSFFSKVFDRDDDDDDDDRKAKSSGFQGLFTELENPEPGAGPGPGPGVAAGRGTSDGDLFADLMEVAEETSQGK